MAGTGAIVLAIYLIVLAALATIRTAPIRSRAVQRLRVLFPSWRFFEELGEVPVLQVRVGATREALGPWRDAIAPVPRRVWALLDNADANLALAAGSLLQHLAADLSDADLTDPASLVSYRLTDHLAAHQARARWPDARAYQFRVVATRPGATAPRDDGDDDDLIRSPARELSDG